MIPSVLLLLLSTTTSRTAATTTTLYGAGALKKGVAPVLAPPGGVVAVVSSPANDSGFFDAGSDSVTVEVDDDGTSNCAVVTSPGAELAGTSDTARGVGAAAAASVAGAVVLTGIHAADVSSSFPSSDVSDTRHGRTLSSVFSGRIGAIVAAEESGSGDEDDATESAKTLVVLAVEGTTELSEDDTERIVSDVRKIFDASVMAADHNDKLDKLSMDDLYEISIMTVNSREDAGRVMAAAVEAGNRSPLAASSGNVVSDVGATFARCARALPTSYLSPAATAERRSVDDALARRGRAARAVLVSWRNRVYGRQLPVDGFGAKATALLEKTVAGFDADTIRTVSSFRYRTRVRAELKDSLETEVRELFLTQAENLGKRALKRFEDALLRRRTDNKDDVGGEYDDDAAAVRTAAFDFDAAMSDLEVPSLSLVKSRYCATMDGKLNAALEAFPTSVAAQLRNLKRVQRRAAKTPKKPTERSVNAGLALVAMVRPDGFGNLQGYAGYTRGSNNLILGLHNDADAPETIAQFGGSRPPLLRVQPKLNLDVEL